MSEYWLETGQGGETEALEGWFRERERLQGERERGKRRERTRNEKKADRRGSGGETEVGAMKLACDTSAIRKAYIHQRYGQAGPPRRMRARESEARCKRQSILRHRSRDE